MLIDYLFLHGKGIAFVLQHCYIQLSHALSDECSLFRLKCMVLNSLYCVVNQLVASVLGEGA